MFETLLSLEDAEARNFAMRFSHSVAFIVDFVSYVSLFSVPLATEYKYSSILAGVISTEGMDDNSRMLIVSKLFQR